MKHRFFIALSLVAITHTVRGQSSEQLWAEYMLNYPFANVWNVEFAGTLSTALQEPRWRSIDFQITPEVALNPNVDLMGAVFVGSTYQSQALSTFELREMLGTRFHFTPNKKIQANLLIRFEQRNLQDIETGLLDQSTRSRIRAESIIPINKPTMYAGDKLFYGILDGEMFLVMDQDVKERFANRFRMRSGIGYRVSYGLRVEFVYTLQLSKNTLDNGANTADNIFRFRVKQYLNRSKPSKALGTGN